jgi:hypothetical protein
MDTSEISQLTLQIAREEHSRLHYHVAELSSCCYIAVTLRDYACSTDLAASILGRVHLLPQPLRHYGTKFRSHAFAHGTLHLQSKLPHWPCFRVDPASSYVSLLSNKSHLFTALDRLAISFLDSPKGLKQQPNQRHSVHVPYATRLLGALSPTPEGLYTRPAHACWWLHLGWKLSQNRPLCPQRLSLHPSVLHTSGRMWKRPCFLGVPPSHPVSPLPGHSLGNTHRGQHGQGSKQPAA